MGDPEALLAEGARRAAVAARELWWRARAPEARREVPLARVKRRLELLVAALYAPFPVLPADPPPAPTWLARLAGRAPAHLVPRAAVASTDGASIWVPRVLPAPDGEDGPIAAYRLLALEQAARAARGTPARAPRAGLVRDLYLLAEGVAVDLALARDLPGLADDLRAGRAAALRERPGLERMTAVEREVEMLYREALATDPLAPPASIPACTTPDESLAWASAVAARVGGGAGASRSVWKDGADTFERFVRSSEAARPADGARLAGLARVLAAARLRVAAVSGRATSRYRGVPPPALWGAPADAAAPPSGNLQRQGDGDEQRDAPRRSAALRWRPRARQAAEGEDDERMGTWMIRPDEPMEAAEDPMGLQRPLDRDEKADAADLADSLSELPEARVVRTPGTPREVLESDAAPVARAPFRPDREPLAAGIVYPEWDYRIGAYRPRGAVVRPGVAPAGSGAWVDAVMARHAALVRRVRRRFDGLRPRRTRVGRQADGPELDLAAYVTAFADRRSGWPGDDRLYVAARPARRDLAIALLIDVSASTDAWVSGSQRIIDVEKESLVVLLEALDALGDRHAALAFSGEGPGDVRVLTVKGFEERAGAEVRRRVAALEPDRYTRAGAAIRHASALLAAQAARHRLLLVLTDGKPNDADGYDGRYGIEDTRQAVAEARLQGLVPFCLTVDREAPAYMPSIFGRSYALLRRQDLLPGVLVEVVRRLVAA